MREKLSNLSEFVREIKVGFTRYYNQRHNRRGYFWGDRFKSVIVEKGETLINCLAYIDLNPLRAGLVDRPEEYRWNSLGYHIQTSNKDNFLSLDFGLKEFGPGEIRSAVTSELHWAGLKEFGTMDAAERLRSYRRYVYEAGAINRPDKMQAKVISDKILEKERKREFELSRSDRFRSRTRYFTDSGVIGSKDFVSKNYMRFKHHFNQKNSSQLCCGVAVFVI